jgi:hypothetical protein
VAVAIVGRCQNVATVAERFQQHLADRTLDDEGRTASETVVRDESLTRRGEGAAWTRLYKPLRILSVVAEKGPGDEDECVLRLMANPVLGIDRVRGGSFSTVDLESHRATLALMLQTRANMCYRCGAPGHYANACLATTSSSSSSTSSSSRFNKSFVPNIISSSGNTNVFSSNTNVFPGNTSAFSNINVPRRGQNGGVGTTSCQCTGHVPFTRRYDHRRPLQRTRAEQSPHQGIKQDDVCFRCGRNTHFVRDCFAVTHFPMDDVYSLCAHFHSQLLSLFLSLVSLHIISISANSHFRFLIHPRHSYTHKERS